MLTRHNVALCVGDARDEASRAGGARALATAHIDALARELAALLPPGQRDRFLITCGVPRA